MRVPRDLQDLSPKVDKARDKLEGQLGRQPTVAEIGAQTQADDEEVLEALQARQASTAVSFEQPVGDREDPAATIGERYSTDDGGFENAEKRADLELLARCLTPRDQEAVRLRFQHDLTQAEIGERLGISQMQVSRILRNALIRMREHATPSDEGDAVDRGPRSLLDGGRRDACQGVRWLSKSLRRISHVFHPHRTPRPRPSPRAASSRGSAEAVRTRPSAPRPPTCAQAFRSRRPAGTGANMTDAQVSDFDVSIEQSGGAAVVRVVGELDLATAPALLEVDVAPGIHRVEDDSTNWYIVSANDGLTIVDAGVPRSWRSLHEALERLGRPLEDIRAARAHPRLADALDGGDHQLDRIWPQDREVHQPRLRQRLVRMAPPELLVDRVTQQHLDVMHAVKARRAQLRVPLVQV